jgi:hypothetical protein
MDLREGYDVKLRGRSSRYRIAHLGPYDDEDYGLAADEFRAQRNIANKPGRKVSHQRTYTRGEVEALCTGMTDNGYPVWQPIVGWIDNYYFHWCPMLGRPSFITHPDTIFGISQQIAFQQDTLEIVYVTPPEADAISRSLQDSVP